jgi:hypothetical protein
MSELMEAMKEAKEKGIKCSHGGTELDDFLASKLWNVFPYSLTYKKEQFDDIQE